VGCLDRHRGAGQQDGSDLRGEALRTVKRIISGRTGADLASRVSKLRRMTVANGCTLADAKKTAREILERLGERR
jgi:hypothetical protein